MSGRSRNEGGFLDRALSVTETAGNRLLMAPAERRRT